MTATRVSSGTCSFCKYIEARESKSKLSLFAATIKVLSKKILSTLSSLLFLSGLGCITCGLIVSGPLSMAIGGTLLGLSLVLMTVNCWMKPAPAKCTCKGMKTSKI